MFTAESLRGGEDPAATLHLQLQIDHPENVLTEKLGQSAKIHA